MTPSNPILRLEPQGGKSPGIRIHAERGEPLVVPLQVWLDSELGIGDSLTRARRERLEAATRRWKAREAALHQLSHRQRSRSELARHLLKKGVAPADVDPVLDDLEKRGFLNDLAFATALARDRIRFRPRGKRRIIQELRQKGVSEAQARDGVEDALQVEETDEGAMAARAGEHWARTQGLDALRVLLNPEFSEAREKVRRRLYAHLARRGFGGPALSSGMDAALAEARTRISEAGAEG